MIENVLQTVWLFFYPEPVERFDMMRYCIRRTLAGAHNDVVIIFVADWPDTLPEATGEEIVPRCETVMWLFGVADIFVFEFPFLVTSRGVPHSCQSRGAKPAVFLIVQNCRGV